LSGMSSLSTTPTRNRNQLGIIPLPSRWMSTRRQNNSTCASVDGRSKCGRRSGTNRIADMATGTSVCHTRTCSYAAQQTHLVMESVQWPICTGV
jgi:hypothetical protein